MFLAKTKIWHLNIGEDTSVFNQCLCLFGEADYNDRSNIVSLPRWTYDGMGVYNFRDQEDYFEFMLRFG